MTQPIEETNQPKDVSTSPKRRKLIKGIKGMKNSYMFEYSETAMDAVSHFNNCH